jgi:hypothetical protein
MINFYILLLKKLNSNEIFVFFSFENVNLWSAAAAADGETWVIRTWARTRSIGYSEDEK